MTDKKNTISVDDASKTVADALDKSGQPLGGTINTDEDDLFAEMMEEAEQEVEVDIFLDELQSDEKVKDAVSKILRSNTELLLKKP